MLIFAGLAVLADLMDRHEHSLVFLSCAVFLYGVRHVSEAIERSRL